MVIPRALGDITDLISQELRARTETDPDTQA